MREDNVSGIANSESTYDDSGQSPYGLLAWVLCAFPLPDTTEDLTADNRAEIPAILDPATYEYEYLEDNDNA